MRNPKAERVRNLLAEIIAECSGDRSESATEAFLVALDRAVREVKKQVRESHEDFLCLDCTTALAYELVPRKKSRNEEPHTVTTALRFFEQGGFCGYAMKHLYCGLKKIVDNDNVTPTALIDL